MSRTNVLDVTIIIIPHGMILKIATATNKVIVMEAPPTDSIQDLLKNIETAEGLLPETHRLLIDGQDPASDQPLSSFPAESRFLLVPISPITFKVRTVANRMLKIDSDTSETV